MDKKEVLAFRCGYFYRKAQEIADPKGDCPYPDPLKKDVK